MSWTAPIPCPQPQIVFQAFGRSRSEPKSIFDGSRRFQVIAEHAGEQVGVDDVLGRGLDDHPLVGLVGACFLRGDECRPDVGEVGADRLRGQHRAAGGDRARQQQRPVEPVADLLHECERRQATGVAACAGCDRNQAVGALVDRLVRERVVDDVVQHDAAVAVDRVVDFDPRTQRRDHDRHAVLHAQRKVVVEPVVRAVHDLVDRERRCGPVGMAAVVLGELAGDPLQPRFELLGRPCVERRERPDDTGLALGDDQVGVRDDEQRRADDRQPQRVLQDRGQAHGR